MWGLLRTQRSPRVQGQEGDSVRDGHSRPSGVDEACYIQLPRVDEGDAAAQQAIHHTQTDHPKMASASSEHIPLLLDDGQGLMEPQLPDVSDDITKAPRRFEQVPLVGAPAADNWYPTDALRRSIKKAIKESDAEGLRKALAGLSPEQTEKALTTGGWYGSAIHYAAGECRDVAVFEVLLHSRRHLLNLKNPNGQTPLHRAVQTGSVGVVEKFVEWGGKHMLEARADFGWTPLHTAAQEGHVDVVEVMLRVDPQLLKIKNEGKTPFDLALKGKKLILVAAMAVVAGDVAVKLVEGGAKMEDVDAKDLKEMVPFTKGFLKDRSDSPGPDRLRLCAFFRKMMQTGQKDSLTDDLGAIADRQEALTTNFCSDTRMRDFEESLKGRETEWFALLESAEPLTVVTQANCISLVAKHWHPPVGVGGIRLSPRDIFISRVLSMLLMVAFVLLHIESIRGDSGMIMAGLWPAVWLWGAVLTGGGFNLQEAFQGIRLKAAYWADSWNVIDMSSSLAIAAFIAVHFRGYSAEAEVSSGIVIALLFALRLLQTASLQPTVGSLILAIVRMFSDISIFLCLYVYILLVFAGVFTVLSSDEDHQYFGSFPKATLTLFFAGQGDFNEALTNAIESHDTLGAVLLFTYVILSSIILVPVFVSEPLRYLASLISEQRREQSALCRIAFWSMKVVYVTVDGLLLIVAFTPVATYKMLEDILRAIGKGDYVVVLCHVLCLPLLILLTPANLLCHYAQWGLLFSFDATKTDSAETADERRKARESYKDRIDKWIEAADHHDSGVPDVMGALRQFKAEIQPVVQQMDKRQTEMDKRQTERQDARHRQMEKRLTEMEVGMEALIREIKAKIK
ncbi:unnamed protein product [Vitrella brassicaformis CCMP3155]|uniref:Ion transport domain-containing protein n=1 Tax=Vitrella brassicaformis (strain CCMP3155) TaxID=1169540 RepID=A0A0G4FRG7_VITBC|nr:unnamed protein product [Vitrella brassicaformis CCMP3155]|eukprot:CEM16844.1 unnamed protein product [Vitrella brassicaformis CCMP3155]